MKTLMPVAQVVIVIFTCATNVMPESLLVAQLTQGSALEDIYNLAVNAYRSGDFKRASQYLEEYVKLRPEPQAYYLLGYSYYKLKLFDKAEEAFNEAYFIDPEFVPPKLDSKKHKLHHQIGFRLKNKILLEIRRNRDGQRSF